LQSLAVQVDVSTKEILANASEGPLIQAYGDIEDTFGSCFAASPGAFFSLLHLPASSPRSGRTAVVSAANTFAANAGTYWNWIRKISNTLTMRAGLTDPVIKAWATFLISEMSKKIPRVDFPSYAGLLQSIQILRIEGLIR
jgi:hypothetical protein